MKISEIKEKLGGDIIERYGIVFQDAVLHIHGNRNKPMGDYMGIAIAAIKEIEEDKATFDIRFKNGVISLWKNSYIRHVHIRDWDRTYREGGK